MCGINGIFGYGVAASDFGPEYDSSCRATRDAMAARGPDGHGFYRDPEAPLVLGHRRLTIIDLSPASDQPMVHGDGDLAVTFNGEIYNYKALRDELAADGVRFSSRGDTEVLLHLYRRLGTEMVHRLDGMFALALWDRRTRTLLLARDPYGIKPLYYADDGACLRFASSARALLAGGGIRRDPDPRSAVAFLAWGSVPEPGTLWRGVRCLAAGSVLAVRDGVGEPRPYWSLAGVFAGGTPAEPAVSDAAEVEETVREALLESVGRHLVADVPVGLFLSAGIDSGALLGLAAEAGAEAPRTVTLAFEEFQGTADDEAPLAASVARRYGARHDKVTLSAREVRAGLDAFLDAMDQPSVDGLNVYWISQAARRVGLKVALSGLGGDELFGGYPSFRIYPRLRRLAGLASLPGLSWAVRLAGTALANTVGVPRRRAKLAHLVSALARPAATYHLVRGVFMPDEIRSLVEPDVWQAAAGESWLEPVEAAWGGEPPGLAWTANAVAEQCVYMRNQLLRDADWASMSHSLEVRLPLVDRRLVTSLGPLLATRGRRLGKAPLAAAPRPPLPGAWQKRPKTGFALPMQAWVGEDCQQGRLPRLPSWLVGDRGRKFVADLAAGVPRGHVHWSRIWALRVLGHLLGEEHA